MVVARQQCICHAHGYRYTHVDHGRDLQEWNGRHLVHFLLRLGSYQCFCIYADIPTLIGLHTGRMECRTLHRPRQRVATRLDGWMAILYEYVCTRLGWYRHGTCVRIPVCLAYLDRTGSFFPAVRYLCSGCRILGGRDGRLPTGRDSFSGHYYRLRMGYPYRRRPNGILDKLAALGELDRINPFAFTGWWSGDFPIAWFITMMMIAFLGGFGMGTTIDWYVEAQRIQSAKTVRDASYSIWWGTIIGLVRNSVWAVAILAFFVLFPAITDPSEYEMGWFRLGFDYLPAGMLGFFFAAILAIHLSTISSHLNLGALYATRDLYQHYVNPKASEKRLVQVGRISTGILLLGSFFYGLIMEDLTSWLIFALWIMAAGIWLPNILQVVWWRFNAWGYLSSWIANLGFSWLVVWILPELNLIPHLLDYQQFWILMILGAMVYFPVTLLTKSEPMDHLVHYYVMSRPIGWWGPVRREAEQRGLIMSNGEAVPGADQASRPADTYPKAP